MALKYKTVVKCWEHNRRSVRPVGSERKDKELQGFLCSTGELFLFLWSIINKGPIRKIRSIILLIYVAFIQPLGGWRLDKVMSCGWFYKLYKETRTDKINK